MKRRGLWFCGIVPAFFALGMSLAESKSEASDNLALTLFGPEAIYRSSGFTLRSFNVPSTRGNFSVTLKNGDNAGNNKVSSAIVKVNDVEIIRQSDFNQQVAWITKPLTNLVAGTNQISVEVSNKSSTSAFVTVSISGVYTLDVAITAPAAGAAVLSDHAAVTGSYAAYTANFGISVNGVGASVSGGTFSASYVPLISGSNMITAVIATADGIQDNDTITVTANRPPVADAGQDRIVTTGETATLDGRNSYDPENVAISFAWSLVQRPPGSAAALDNGSLVMPSFVPDLPGIYIASLTVGDGWSVSAPDTVTLTAELPNVPPTANAGPDQSAVTGTRVFLDGRASADPEQAPLYYSWSPLSVPSGSSAVLDNAASATPSFVPDRNGDYLFGLIVNDGVHNSLPDNVLVTAATPNAPPVAYAGPDNTVFRNSVIRLDGRGSYDPDNDFLSFFWSIVSKPAGSGSMLDNATSPVPSLPADAEGDYAVRLTVSDGRLSSAPDTVVVTSVNANPVADAGPDQTLPRMTTTTLAGSGSSDANNDPLTYTWSIVSAPVRSTAAIGNPTAVNPLFQPDQAGIYLIRLTVNDGHGGSASDNVTITATAPQVTTPNVVGMPQVSAQSSITSAGLSVGIITQAHSSAVVSGNVASQSPAGGSTVYEGAYVDLTVSLGPVMVNVPNVVGTTQTAAQSSIVAAGLAVGTVTQSHSTTIPSGNVISQIPAGGASAPEGSAVDIVVSTGPVMVVVPDVIGKPQGAAQSAITSAGLSTGTVAPGPSDTVIPGDVASQTPAAGTAIPQGSSVDLVISSGPPQAALPPDPSTTAPPIDRTVATNLYSSTQFLYSAATPIQTGVVPGTIELVRAAVVRGRVLSSDNTPLPGVAVTVLNHPEYGRTTTRSDGMFDLAVNGGGFLTVDYRKGGYPPVQRQADTPWQGFVSVPDVILVPYDSQVTPIDLSSPSPVQVARGNVTVDPDGTRQSTLLFSQGTHATLKLPDGGTRAISSLNVRATEYTVGSNGPKAMPGPLPPTTGYTYCVELSVDEVVAVGAEEVIFDRPVINYTENYLGFPVGAVVPSGYYDRRKGVWVPSADGRVIKVVGVTAGLADLDIDGNGTPDNTASLGVTDAERTQIASLYAAGTSLWRVPLNHFSPLDLNYPVGPPAGAVAANQPRPEVYLPTDACTRTGSVIECQNQVLGEHADVAGTPFRLNYRSDRVRGRKDAYDMKIFLSGAAVPSTVKRIELEVYVAGQRHLQSFSPAPNLSTIFAWDGKDAYGRVLQGAQTATVRVGYVYPAVYLVPGATGSGASFGGYGGTAYAMANRAALESTIWQMWNERVGVWDAWTGLGGWTLSAHHSYDPVGGILHSGDGTFRSVDDTLKTISTVAGTGQTGFNGDGIGATQANLTFPYDVAAAPDGSIYIADYYNVRIRRVDPGGIITTVAGNGQWSLGADNVPATQTGMGPPMGVAVGPDGSVYFSDYWYHRVRKVSPSGLVTTAASNGLNTPNGLAVGPDGVLYIADGGNNYVYRVGADGIPAAVAGNGAGIGCDWCAPGDGGPARGAYVPMPRYVAFGPDGSLYISQSWRLRKVAPNGIISTVARSGQTVYDVDGITSNTPDMDPMGVAVAPGGEVYFADHTNNRVRRIGTDGIVSTIAGTGMGNVIPGGYGGDGGPPNQAKLNSVYAVSRGPDDSLYVADVTNERIRKIAPSLPGLSVSDIKIASKDGGELYIFNGSGKHQRTVNALTGAVLYGFAYDGNGLLSQVTDADNNVTSIERDGSGNPTAIVAPGGQRTAFTLDPGGYLASVSDPGGNTVGFAYTPDGLLTGMTDPNGNPHGFSYDGQGRLSRDDDPEGGFTTLSRSGISGNSFRVTDNTALGRSATYLVERLSTGVSRWTNAFPAGAISVAVESPDGKRTVTGTDNTVSEVTRGPDPRWGMESPPATKVTVRTPGGLISTATSTRGVTLSNPADPMSLVAQSDNVTVNGNVYRRTYNASQRRFTLTTPVGRAQIAGIDAQGRTVLVNAAPAVDNVLFAYDSKGRLAQTSQGGKTWVFGYDDKNRLTSQTDPVTHSVQYAYDNSDRVNRVILPSGRTYGFAHDNNGNVTAITMPSGAVHGLGYTKINLDNSYTPPGNPAYGTQYNLDREWKRTILPSGKTVDGAYDNGGRLHDVTYQEAAASMTYFDNTDRVGTITRASAVDNQTIAFSYDGFLTTRMAFSGVANGEYRYSYNNDFNVTGVALDNVWTTLGRDADGLLTQYGRYTITRNGPAGAPSALTDNTLNISYTYDSSGRLWTRTHTVAAIPVYAIQLGYDNVGRIAQKIEIVSGTAHTFDYEYDLDGQLFEVRKDGILVEQNGYDNNANRTSTLAAMASYDDQDRLIQQGSVSYTFDADGFLVQRGVDTFTYSARGELLSATVGGQTVGYHYDGMGRRIGKTDAAGTTQYLYGNLKDRFQVTATRDSAGVLTTYFYASRKLYAFERGGVRYYVGADQIGTPKVVSDSSGTVIKAIDYDAFGVKVSDSNPSLNLPIGFAGGIGDDVTRLVRFGRREYEPETGRWAAKDPILFASGQPNLYVYAANSPPNFVDPSGLKIAVFGNMGDYRQALTYLGRDPGMANIIRDLENSSTTYNVILNNLGDDSYDPTSHTINWDPHSALGCTGGGTQSPALGLGHEMAHADVPWYWRLIGWIPLPGYDYVEEWRVIRGPETNAARTLGEGTRTDHGGTSYWVPTPTSR